MPNPSSAWNDPVKLASACAFCDGKRASCDVRVLGEDGEAALVHATCRRCRASSLSLVARRGEAGTALTFATDLSASDASRLRDARPVSVDDVIDWHAFALSPAFAGLAREARPAKKRANVRSKAHPKRH